MNYKHTFLQQFPSTFFATVNDRAGLSKYLKQISFLTADEVIKTVTIPGAGNMNVVIRIKTNQRSFILKQSRPWVEKYPSIDAPINRIQTEAVYYATIQNSSILQSYSPEILLVDVDNFIILMEDLGTVEDFTKIYVSGVDLTQHDITNLSKYLIELHRFRPDSFPSNTEMRVLNHAHIFDIPFQQNNGIDLNGIQQGLAELARPIVNDSALKRIIQTYGESYLSTGSTLLHGDYYPGSWMQSDQFYVLDPEFSFLGPAEFDIGVCLAHLTIAHQEQTLIHQLLQSYQSELPFDERKVNTFAGIEILRRLLGVAQLPLDCSLDRKEVLIDTARSWILGD